jgi:hypothetical protein
MYCTRTNFTGSVERLVCLGHRSSQVVLLASFAAMAGVAGNTSAAEPSPAGATAALSASRDELRQQAIEKYKKWSMEIDRQRDVIGRERARCMAQQRGLRDEIIKTCDVSPENVLPILLALEKDRFALEIEVNLKRFRQTRIDDMMAMATSETQKRIESDGVLQHLEKIIDVRKAARDRAQALRKTSVISESDVQQAGADLDEAQIRAELRKEELAKSPAKAEAGRMVQQARELCLDLAQDELRLKILNGKLAGLKKARGLLDEYSEITDFRLPALNRQSQELETREIQGRIEAP